MRKKSVKKKSAKPRPLNSKPLTAKKATVRVRHALKLKSAASRKSALKSIKSAPHLKSISPSIKSQPPSFFSSVKKNAGKAHDAFLLSLIVVIVFAALSLVATSGSSENSSSFRQKLQQVSTLTLGDDDVTLIATGDILLARYAEQKMRGNNDYTYPFHNVAEFLKNADITFGNLKNPLMKGYNTPKDSTTFRADPQSIEGLAFAGFDVISLANNKTMGYQAPGLLRTLDTFKESGILTAGAGADIDEAHSPAVVSVKGKKIAFYAYNDDSIPPKVHGEATATKAGIAAMDLESVRRDVENARTSADIVVVGMNAGKEYSKEPTQFQRDFAHTAIDAGASVVIGYHTHVVQPVENYKDGIIFYGLGNFVFDQFFSEDVRTGLAAKITFGEGNKPTAELFPVRLDTIQPRIVEGDEREAMLETLGLLQ